MIKLGVFGARRGECMIRWCNQFKKAQVVAICDFDETIVNHLKDKFKDMNIKFYKHFDEFIKHDLDAVILANYATEHAPFAIKCLDAKIHVLSEVLPCQTMKEAVELVEAVDRNNVIYAYAENYCYMPATREMRRLYQKGELGEFEYGEGEYVHNCEPLWPMITYGDKNHWRNNMYSTYYCTHSIGPLIHITGLKPIKVVGFELPFNEKSARMGSKAGSAGIEIITLENGTVIKSLHGVALEKNSIWYSIYGTKGRIESAREDAQNGAMGRIYTNLNKKEGKYIDNPQTYLPEDDERQKLNMDHGSSDYIIMNNFVNAIKGKKSDIIGVYEALDMFLPGMFAYYSILNNNSSMIIPNLRLKEERDKYRNDTRCVNKEKAGDMLIPSYSKGDIEIPNEIYQKIKKDYLKTMEEK